MGASLIHPTVVGLRLAVAVLPVRLGAAALALFAAVALLVHLRLLEPADLALMRLAQWRTGPTLDLLAGLINYAAAAEVTLLLMIGLAALLWRVGLPPAPAASPLLFLFSFPIELTLKFTLDQPVPREFYRRTLHYGLAGLHTMQSFPSGHAIRSAFMALLLGYLAWRWRGRGARPLWAALALAVVVFGWSRVYQGHHWPMDVLGGNLLGVALALFAIALLEPTRKRPVPAEPERGV